MINHTGHITLVVKQAKPQTTQRELERNRMEDREGVIPNQTKTCYHYHVNIQKDFSQQIKMAENRKSTWTACSKAQEIPSSSWTCLIEYGIERFVSIKCMTGRQESMTTLQESPVFFTECFSRTTSKASSPFWPLLVLLIQVVVSGLIQIMFTVETLGSPAICRVKQNPWPLCNNKELCFFKSETNTDLQTGHSISFCLS